MSGRGLPGTVVFLTGLSGAGKSTIAEALTARLSESGAAPTLIDGDVLRRDASADLGFDRASREANIQRAARLAAEAVAPGGLAVTALIAPFEGARERARATVEDSGARFVLVFVRTPLEVAEARDPKGLYRRARGGEIEDFTGISSPFEEPASPDLVIDTTITPVEEAVDRIVALLNREVIQGQPAGGAEALD